VRRSEGDKGDRRDNSCGRNEKESTYLLHTGQRMKKQSICSPTRQAHQIRTSIRRWATSCSSCSSFSMRLRSSSCSPRSRAACSRRREMSLKSVAVSRRFPCSHKNSSVHHLIHLLHIDSSSRRGIATDDTHVGSRCEKCEKVGRKC
jgi:hypothetical protein